MNVFELFATLSLDTSEYDKSLDSAENSASGFGNKLKTGLKTAGKIGGAAIGVVATATTTLTASLVKGTQSVASYGDNIDKMSQKMGISAEAYQEWEAVMQHSGTSMETLKAGMKTLANAVENGNAAFERLGITQEDIANMNNEELFSATITALQGVENETERTYLAGQLLGRGATELGALLNTSAEETQAMKDRVHELGGVLSDDAVKAAAGFQDSLQDMQTAFAGVGRNLLSDFLPSITTVMDGLTAIFSGDDSGLGKLTQGVNDFADNILQALPQIMDIAGQIVSSLLTSIIDNLPTLISAGMQVISELATGILENLPSLIRSALDIIKTIGIGIIQALPTLIPAIVDIILEIVDVLVDNIDLLVDGAIALVTGLAEGIINALPRLLEKAPVIIEKLVQAIIRNVPKIISAAIEIVVKLVQGIIQNLPKMGEAATKIVTSLASGIASVGRKLLDIGKSIFQSIKDGLFGKIGDAANWGKDMIDNFVGGIKDKMNAVKDAVKGVGEKIKGFLGFSEPEEGPLSNFHTYAPDMMKLFAKGISDSEDLLYNQIKDTFDFGDMMTATADVKMNGISGRTSGYASDTNTIIELLRQLVDKEVVQISANADEIFNIVKRKNNEYFETTGDYAFIGG